MCVCVCVIVCPQWLVLWLDCDREGENIACDVRDICMSVNRRLQVFRGRFSALIPADIQHAGSLAAALWYLHAAKD